MNMTFDVVAYDENHIYLKDGSILEPPLGYKYDVDIIKKIIEAGEEK